LAASTSVKATTVDGSGVVGSEVAAGGADDGGDEQ